MSLKHNRNTHIACLQKILPSKKLELRSQFRSLKCEIFPKIWKFANFCHWKVRFFVQRI